MIKAAHSGSIQYLPAPTRPARGVSGFWIRQVLHPEDRLWKCAHTGWRGMSVWAHEARSFWPKQRLPYGLSTECHRIGKSGLTNGSICPFRPNAIGSSRFLSGSFGSFRVLSGPIEFFQVLSGFFESFRVLSGFSGSFRILSGSFGCFRVLSDPFESFQVLSGPFALFRVFSDPFGSFRVFSRFLPGLIVIAFCFTNPNQEVTVLNYLLSNSNFEHENIVIYHLLYNLGKMQETIHIRSLLSSFLLFLSPLLCKILKSDIYIYIYIYIYLTTVISIFKICLFDFYNYLHIIFFFVDWSFQMFVRSLSTDEILHDLSLLSYLFVLWSFQHYLFSHYAVFLFVFSFYALFA